jgi:hypothetical protein
VCRLVKKEASERAAPNVLLLLTMIGGIFFERLLVHAQPYLAGAQPVLKIAQPCLSLKRERSLPHDHPTFHGDLHGLPEDAG